MRVKVRVYNEEYVGHVSSHESEHELEDLYVYEHPVDGHLSLCDRSQLDANYSAEVVAWRNSGNAFSSPMWNHNDDAVWLYVFECIVVEPVDVCYGVEFDGYGGYAVVHGRPPELNDPETNAAIQNICRAAYDSLEEKMTHTEKAAKLIKLNRASSRHDLPVSEEAHRAVDRELVMASYEDHAKRGTR